MATARNKKEDFYDILGVSRNATDVDIKRAFRALAKQHHPDVTKNPADAGKFKKISEAYDTLSDPQKRKMYDQFGHDGPNQGFGGGGFQHAGGFSDLGDIFGDIFGDMFGGGQRQQQAYSHSGGQNYLKNIVIDLADAVLGAKKTLNLNVEMPCDACKQTGARTPKDYVTCSGCNGKGIRDVISNSIFGQIKQQVVCNHCQGIGKIITQKCLKCKGNRYYIENQNLEFNIPPGIVTGDSLRIKGKGGCSRTGKGPQGDLIIKVAVREDKYFTRKGNDLFINIPVSYLDILLGNIITIPTIDGLLVKKELKLGMQDGDHIIIPHHGCYYNRNHRGNLVAVIKIKMPTKKEVAKDEKDKLWNIYNNHLFEPNSDFIEEIKRKK